MVCYSNVHVCKEMLALAIMLRKQTRILTLPGQGYVSQHRLRMKTRTSNIMMHLYQNRYNLYAGILANNQVSQFLVSYLIFLF